MASKKEWKATAKNYEALYREAIQWRNYWWDRFEAADADLKETLAEIEAWRSGAAGDYYEEAQWGSANDPR